MRPQRVHGEAEFSFCFPSAHWYSTGLRGEAHQEPCWSSLCILCVAGLPCTSCPPLTRLSQEDVCCSKPPFSLFCRL